jgi:RNA-binding protein
MNFTSKQRASLRAIAHTIEPACIIGKGGVSDAVKESVDKYLDKNELIKISVLKTCELKAKEIAPLLADSLGASVVECIGNKAVLYRYSDKENVKHIEF